MENGQKPPQSSPYTLTTLKISRTKPKEGWKGEKEKGKKKGKEQEKKKGEKRKNKLGNRKKGREHLINSQEDFLVAEGNSGIARLLKP